jgi:hypothetical protein
LKTFRIFSGGSCPVEIRSANTARYRAHEPAANPIIPQRAFRSAPRCAAIKSAAALVSSHHENQTFLESTGNYLVNAGEGRRLAQLLCVKRKEIKADEPIGCILDIEHSAVEISSADNAIHSARCSAENARYSNSDRRGDADDCHSMSGCEMADSKQKYWAEQSFHKFAGLLFEAATLLSLRPNSPCGRHPGLALSSAVMPRRIL